MEYELLLINVVRDFNGYSDCFKESIGQYILAAYLRKHYFKAYVYSGISIEAKKVIQREIEEKKVPVIGFYAAADNIRVVRHIIKWIKKKYPYIKTIIGGPQAIGLDYQFFEETKNDFAIIGEGEIPICKLMSFLIDGEGDISKIPSIVYSDKQNQLLIINQSTESIITDLDSIPYPSMEDSLNKNLRQGKMVGIITGRGCPNHCAFCYEGANAKNVRFRSINNVMEEIDYVIKYNENVKYLNIYDDTFTLQKNRVLEFCDKIKKRNIKWFCESHVLFVLKHPEVVKKMVESGLLCMQFGIESGSNKVLEGYNKNINSEMIFDAIKVCKKSGVHGITGNFIIGGAFETLETIEKSKELAKRLIYSAKGILELYAVYFAPYPNTQIVREPEKFDMKLSMELQEYNLNTMRSPVVETKELSSKAIYDIKKGFDEFLEEVYRQAALESTKEDVIQGLFVNGKREHLNVTWERHYMALEHIVNFIQHLSEEEQYFNPNYYMIRTFEDMIEVNDVLITKLGTFSGLEKDVLKYATGIYSAKMLSEKLNVNIEKIEKIFYKLNNKCMLYMSEF